jgi:UDP-3-O-[3-hydroxymyristoyl] N-acetylglucosamine deacetylase
VRNQQTLAAPITCSGVGLHSGQPVTITLRPAPVNTGVVFVNRNGKSGASLPASIENLVPTELCTAINGNGFQVKTIEHVLAALSGLGVDNVYIDVTAGEIPVMDGSAAPFVRLIQSVGLVSQSRRQSYLKIMAPIEVCDGQKRVRIEPSSTPKITYTIRTEYCSSPHVWIFTRSTSPLGTRPRPGRQPREHRRTLRKRSHKRIRTSLL